ncbi:bis(5'-nucleosyl)-tetraphosphatase (symmetrical) YqeK [Hazenella sp. IB182357]|uniref:bis(5'-nucleosyl)-tetraphosphatase (symmetrical) n=1 Tax=Polycladospora coralii TaxID=2771432 RepID=A0A926NGF2_9BACL|nr:bis(5'-nucleosyl)-tetraphosphatase (symmetrical) YqeK [Polycladospora coralii]MBD1372873.1 bis(5'-nucleosyl)-tetraphosphatase (symmetrical) YqeK [Polycladospora coralii]
MNLDILKQATKNELPTSRWEHTLRVLDTAIDLIQDRQIDLLSIQVAAVLHDFCKFWPDEELKKWISKYELPRELLHYHKEIWHAPVGAEVARIKWGITDEAILNAIRYHTTGRPEMTEIEKIIFVADYIEPGRKFPDVEEVRKTAETHLDGAVAQSLRNTISFLESRNQMVYPLTLQAYGYYKHCLG